MALTEQLAGLETVRVEEADENILLVTLNRPERLNAITSQLMEDMTQVIQAVDLDRTARAVILTGGGRGFCAGLDLVGDSSIPPGAEGVGTIAGRFMVQDQIASLNERIHRSRKPWIAAVNGPCVGGGFAMALACDIRIATTSARFGAVFIKVGASNCDMGTSYFLPRLVGASRSAELLLTGRIFEADEAEKLGLVIDVVDNGAEVERSLEVARLIRANPPFGTWMTKETMWETVDSPSLRHAIDMENRTQIMCTATGEFEHAITAFQEKRLPEWDQL